MKLWTKVAIITACVVGPLTTINYLPYSLQKMTLDFLARHWWLLPIPAGLIIARQFRRGGKK